MEWKGALKVGLSSTCFVVALIVLLPPDLLKNWLCLSERMEMVA